MRDGIFYKMAAERGYLLKVEETGARLISTGDGPSVPLVDVKDGKPVSVVPKSWEAELADNLVRLIRSNMAQVRKLANPERATEEKKSGNVRTAFGKRGK